MLLSKRDIENAKSFLKKDFVPNGKSVKIDTLTFRRTKDYEAYHCCRQRGYDIQSGPTFCGDLAEYIAFAEDGSGVVALCKRDKPPDRLIKS